MSATEPKPHVGSVHELPGGGRALFTSRAHGNLSSVGGDGREQGAAARERLRAAIGAQRLARAYQIHGTTIERVRLAHAVPIDDVPSPRVQADGHAVSARSVAAMVLTADCVPVVLGAQGAVAAIHAGWRGLAAGVLEEGVRALRDVGGRGDVVAVVGPCAGACCYEVGEDVHAAFHGAHRTGRLIDLRAIVHERLLSAGVASVAHERACTICDERFFSHRREGSRAGRQGGVAWLS